MAPAGTPRRSGSPRAFASSTCRPTRPELQPAETLWVHVDAPIVNRHFDTLTELDAVVGEDARPSPTTSDLIRGQAGFHWWPNRTIPI